MKEVFENLRGKTVLIIESEKNIQELFVSCYRNGMSIDISPNTPPDLTEYMDRRKLGSAIIHPTSAADEDPILLSQESGNKVVIIERDPPATIEEERMYSRFKEAGIPAVRKRIESLYLKQAIRKLSELWNER